MKITAEIINRSDLTRREAEVFGLVCEGLPDKTISQRLAISLKTVEAHLDRVYSKIGVQHQQLNVRAASIATAVARGWVKLTINAFCFVLMIGSAMPHDDAMRTSRTRLIKPAMTKLRRID